MKWKSIFWIAVIVGCAEKQPIRLNHIQVIGSHNSYKQAIDPGLVTLISTNDTAVAAALSYAHPLSLAQQLDLGLRNLELDVFADSLGGRYSAPAGLKLIEDASALDTGILRKPGFKVFHIPDIDFRSSCLLLESCLTELKEWSDSHPQHEPVFITLEAKDQNTSRTGFPFTPSEDFTNDIFYELDRLLLAILTSEKLFTPDQLRRDFHSLREAALTQNWPVLESVKGKFLIVLDDAGRKRTSYLELHPGLRGAVMFTNSQADSPEAAMMILNDARNPLIPELVKQGFIIRTRADANTTEARNDDYSTFEAACASGAQIISTDYYQRSQFFPSDYQISFENKTYIRINPFFP